jgi:hypothetical protein
MAEGGIDSVTAKRAGDGGEYYRAERCSRLVQERRSELLRTDESHDGCQHARIMKKRSRSKGSAKTTLASIKREMQKPRLTESVRNEQSRQAKPAEVHSKPTTGQLD